MAGIRGRALVSVSGMQLSTTRRVQSVIRWFFGLLALLAVACGPSAPARDSSFPAFSERNVLGPGDVFSMEIVGEKELPREYQVASDGTVDLPYLHTVRIADLEAQEVARLVRDKLIEGKILLDPSVVVQVKEYASRRVTLLGQVARPGSFPLAPGMTLIQAISEAGGLTAVANSDNVNLIRKTATGKQSVVVSVGTIQEGKAPDIPLQAGDQIYVHERIF
jgi:protein involved in polysaccharide export with SLBB domain